MSSSRKSSTGKWSKSDSRLLHPMSTDYNHIDNTHSINMNLTDSTAIQKSHDPEALDRDSTQQISLNINHRSTRLTLWAMLILIVSVAEINFTLSMRIFYQTYKRQFNADTDPNPYGGTRFYDAISVTANTFLLIASTMILLKLHKSMLARLITSSLFAIGATLHLTHDIWGIRLYCIDDPTKPSIDNDNAFCRMSFMGSDLYCILFLLFFILDIVKSYGDKIRVRVFVHSMFLSAISFMNAGNSYHDDKEFEKDTALVFVSSVVGSGYLIIALLTLVVFATFCLAACSYWLLMSGTRDGIQCDPSKVVRNGMSFCLLIGVGMVLTSPYIYIFVTGSVDEIGTPPIHSLVYYMVAVVLFVYDLQYVK